MTAPLIHLADDTPRARRDDPLSSHVAADLSGWKRRKVTLAVVEMVREDGPMTGVDINADYPNWQETGGPYFPRCAPDSPRKRAGDAEREGLLRNIQEDPKGDALYEATQYGLDLLERLGR